MMLCTNFVPSYAIVVDVAGTGWRSLGGEHSLCNHLLKIHFFSWRCCCCRCCLRHDWMLRLDVSVLWLPWRIVLWLWRMVVNVVLRMILLLLLSRVAVVVVVVSPTTAKMRLGDRWRRLHTVTITFLSVLPMTNKWSYGAGLIGRRRHSRHDRANGEKNKNGRW